MTQKEKIAMAKLMAHRIKGIAKGLRYDANDYDVKFPLGYAKELETIAEEFLKL